jgi:hypothetical protein
MQDTMMIDGMRYRKLDKRNKLDEKLYKEIEQELTTQSVEKELANMEKFSKAVDNMRVERNTYHLTRIIIIRYLAFIYLVAFVVALNQNYHLLGKNGLLPANKFMDNYYKQSHKPASTGVGNSKKYSSSDKSPDYPPALSTQFSLFMQLPTLFWFFDWRRDIDTLLLATSLSGITLAGFVFVQGAANSIIMLALWLLYHSIINIGQTWYSFGWESQVVESGFIAVFLVPLLSLRQVNIKSPPSIIILCVYRWLISRIMMGAVKQNSDYFLFISQFF